MQRPTPASENTDANMGRLCYVQLAVNDLDVSLAFYIDLLEMRLLRRQDFGEAHVSLAFLGYEDDATMLGLRYTWGHGALERHAEFGPIAIGTPDWERVGRRLEEAGVHVYRPSARTVEGARIAFLHDPNGVEIELIEELEKPDAVPVPMAAERVSEARPTASNTTLAMPSLKAPEVPPAATKRRDSARDRILEAAGRGFRLRGYGGIGVDGLAKEAGVTSGAFYGHFRSKEEAFQAAVTTGLDDFRAGVERFRAEQGADWVRVFANWYLGKPYLEDIAGSCALPSLSPDVVRSDAAVRMAYEQELSKLASAIAAGLPEGPVEQQQSNAWVFLALLAGGVTLARAVEDEALATQIAASVRDAVIQLSR